MQTKGADAIVSPFGVQVFLLTPTTAEYQGQDTDKG